VVEHLAFLDHENGNNKPDWKKMLRPSGIPPCKRKDIHSGRGLTFKEGQTQFGGMANIEWQDRSRSIVQKRELEGKEGIDWASIR